MPKSEVLKKMIADGVAAELKRIEEGKGATETEPVVEDKKQAAIAAKVDLTNAELLEKLKEEKTAAGKTEKVQCGGCGEIFEGEKEKCPKCGKTLEW